MSFQRVFCHQTQADVAARPGLKLLVMGIAFITPLALYSQSAPPGAPTSGSGSGAPLATAQLSLVSAQIAVGSGLSMPAGVAVDKMGDVFIADTGNNRILEISPARVQSTIGSGLSMPAGVAVDAAGDVFIADTGNARVVEVPVGGDAQTTIYGGTHPVGVAVNSAGYVYIADTANPRVSRVPPAGSGLSVARLGSGLSQPAGVALDAAGDLFISDSGNNLVVEISSTGQSTVASGLNQPTGIAVDGSGDLFVANTGAGSVVEIPAGGGAQTTAGSGLNQPMGVAVDGGGDVFIADSLNNRVVEVLNAPVSLNMGTANICPPGQATPATCSQSATLNYSVAIRGEIGAVNALTAGAPNLDFTLNSTTCTGELLAGSSCVANVTFTPLAPGMRMGAIQMTYTYAGQESLIGTTLIYGQGQGPAIAFGPGVQTTIPVTGLSVPLGLAVDGAGDLFIADSENSRVVEIPAGGGAQTTVGTGLSSPTGLAIDGAGDLFIADAANNQVVEVPSGGAQTTLGAGLHAPADVAVDGAGDIFIADQLNNRVVEIPAGGGAQITVGSGFIQPMGVAVDGAGDVFISDYGNNRVVEVPAGSGAQTTLDTELSYPHGVAVDAAGDLFIADVGNNRVVELPAGGGAQMTLAIPTFFVKLDSAGDLFMANASTTTVLEIERSPAPTLSFPSTAIGSVSAPQSLLIQNVGNETLNAIAPGLSIGTNFEQQAGSGTPPDCTSAFSLTPGMYCNLSINFAPQSSGNLQGTAVFTDNALNAAAGVQTVSLNGAATGGPLANLSGQILRFGSQNVGSTSGPLTVTLSNLGTQALSIESITASGNFSETNNCGSSIMPNVQSCLISVTFTPQSSGALTGTLTVTDNTNDVAGSIQTVSLTGTGTGNQYDSAISVALSSTTLVYPGQTNVVITVAGNGGKTATGSVTVYDGTTALYTATLSDGAVYWYIPLPGLSVGTHLISASYTGDSNNPAGQSAPVTVTVSPVPVDLSVSCWNASFPYGGNQTCSVSVSSNAGNALGAVTYTFDNNAPVSVPLSNNTQFTIGTPATGSHMIVIGYAQQGNFAASGPNTQTFTVTQAPTQIQLTPASYYLAAGSSLTLSASLTSWSAGPPTSGVVNFLDNGTAIGTANVNAQGQASFTVASVAAGSHNYTAQFGGLPNFAPVTSASASVTAQ